MAYRICKPNQYLVVTGAWIKDIKICKKAWVFPGQLCEFFDISPSNYTLNLQAMSQEKLEFLLPAVFTIGPRDDHESLGKFCRLMVNSKTDSNHVRDLITGIIEGETRVLAAGMTMEQIFRESKEFKDSVYVKVQAELDQFGLIIYNANIKQLQDAAGSEYFQYMRMKTHEGAINQAKVDVAEAKYMGDVGERKRQGLTSQNIASIESETCVIESNQQAQVAKAKADLLAKKAAYDRDVVIAQIEGKRATEVRDAILQQEVEKQRAMAETERIRADLVAKATAAYEVSVQQANAELYRKQKESEAELYAQQNEAAGVQAKYEAQAAGVASLFRALDNNPAAFRDYMLIDRGIYQELAQANAQAIQGLDPKITIWQTGPSGGEGEGASDPTKPLGDIFRMIPPLFTTIQEQTGVTPFPWMARVDPPKSDEAK